MDPITSTQDPAQLAWYGTNLDDLRQKLRDQVDRLSRLVELRAPEAIIANDVRLWYRRLEAIQALDPTQSSSLQVVVSKDGITRLQKILVAMGFQDIDIPVSGVGAERDTGGNLAYSISLIAPSA